MYLHYFHKRKPCGEHLYSPYFRQNSQKKSIGSEKLLWLMFWYWLYFTFIILLMDEGLRWNQITISMLLVSTKMKQRNYFCGNYTELYRIGSCDQNAILKLLFYSLHRAYIEVWHKLWIAYCVNIWHWENRNIQNISYSDLCKVGNDLASLI